MGSLGVPPTEVPTEDPMMRWRNYQHLIWSQQQIHLHIQQQHALQQQQQDQQHPNPNKREDDGNCPSSSAPPLSPHSPITESQSPGKSSTEKPPKEPEEWEPFDSHSAFLGPSLWEKRLPYDGHDFKLEYVDLEEFLTENGIPLDENGKHVIPGVNGHIHGPMNSETGHPYPVPPQFYPGLSRSHTQVLTHLDSSSITSDYASSSRSPSPSSSSITSQDMLPDSTQSTSSDQTSNPEDFDPRMRMFSTDELKPSPMIKKSKKQFVPDDAKDAKYWMRRRKNNMAAKRSRDARRVKENQIAMRACYLEKENQFFKQELERVQKENTLLKEQLTHYSVTDQQQQQQQLVR